MIDRQDIFPVPVFRSFLEIDNEKKLDLVSAVEKIKNIEQPKNSPINTYTDFFNKENTLSLEEFSIIKEHIDQIVNQIHETVGLNGTVCLSNSWATITNFGGYHETHIHANSIWSGVFYLKADSNDAPLCFVNPMTIDFSRPDNLKSNDNFYFLSQIDIPVTTGMVVIFPSYLPHKVLQQKTNSDRITIAFNYKLENV